MHSGPGRLDRPGVAWLVRAASLATACLLLTACSESTFGDLGDRSSGWIGEVATTLPTTTTTAPAVMHGAMDAEWVNDTFDAPDPDSEPNAVLAGVFARSADSSRFLQASRHEIVAVAPEARFPETLPVDAAYVTSQLVIESRELRLSNEPTVAFGLWSAEPYTRSRSVAQVGVLNLSTDPAGVQVATEDEAGVCLLITPGEAECALEQLRSGPVWRMESAAGVSHIWYADPFRYDLEGLDEIDEELVHQVIDSLVPLSELLPEP